MNLYYKEARILNIQLSGNGFTSSDQPEGPYRFESSAILNTSTRTWI